MANLKTKKTAAGAQQYSSKDGAAKLNKAVDKDIQAYLDDKMTRAEFKKKYGVSVDKAQNMVYAANAAERSDETDSQSAKDIWDRHEKGLKKRKRNNMSKGGMTKKKMGYNKGGYVNCGASVPGTQKT